MASSILSLLLTYVMLLSGAGYSADIQAPSSMVTTISDIVIRLDGTEYPIAPSISVGAASENGEAILDFHVPYGEENLFPVQAKVSEDSVSVMLGSSSTAYTFTAGLLDELIETSGDPADMNELVSYYGDYMRVLSSADSLEPSEEELNAFAEKVTAALENVQSEEAAFTVNGEEYTGQHFTCVLTHEQLCKLADELFSMGDGALGEAYFGYLNALLTMSGEEMEPIDSFAQLCELANMEINTDLDMTMNDTCGVADAVMHFTASEDGESVAFDIPMHMEIYGEDAWFSVNMPLDDSANLVTVNGESVSMEDAGLTFDMTVHGDEVALLFEVTDETSTLHISVDAATKEDDSTSLSMEMIMDFPEEELFMHMIVSGDAAADMTGVTDCSVDMSIYGNNFGLSFRETKTRDAVEDRISGATEQIIASQDDLGNASGLTMAAMGMMSDVEKLMNDEGIAALVDAWTQMVSSGVTDYAAPNYSSDPADLPFPVPELTVLPEGYEVTETNVYAYTDPDYAYMGTVDIYAGNAETGSSALNVNVRQSPDEGETTYYDANGTKLENMESTIAISRYDGYTTAYAVRDGLNITVNDYSGTLSDEELIAILNGITFPESAAEEAPADGEDTEATDEVPANGEDTESTDEAPAAEEDTEAPAA